MQETPEKPIARERPAARERILSSAYDLFTRQTVSSVGIDAIVAEAKVAKMTLYRHFRTKDELVLAFLERRERLWTYEWLEAEILRSADDPRERLLAVFDLFHNWMQQPDYRGCSFISVLLESAPGGAVNEYARRKLAAIRVIIARQARAAGLKDVPKFSQTWHILMKGAIVAAQEGYLDAARDAQAAARMVLGAWPRA